MGCEKGPMPLPRQPNFLAPPDPKKYRETSVQKQGRFDQFLAKKGDKIAKKPEICAHKDGKKSGPETKSDSQKTEDAKLDRATNPDRAINPEGIIPDPANNFVPQNAEMISVHIPMSPQNQNKNDPTLPPDDDHGDTPLDGGETPTKTPHDIFEKKGLRLVDYHHVSGDHESIPLAATPGLAPEMSRSQIPLKVNEYKGIKDDQNDESSFAPDKIRTQGPVIFPAIEKTNWIQSDVRSNNKTESYLDNTLNQKEESAPTFPMSSKPAGFFGAVEIAPSQKPNAAAPVSVLNQIDVSMRSVSFKEGRHVLTISLTPEDLGRLTIKVDISADGHVNAVVHAAKADTYDLLRQDQSLHDAILQTLTDQGLKSDSGSLSFSTGNGGNNGGGNGESDAPDHDPYSSVTLQENNQDGDTEAQNAAAVDNPYHLVNLRF